MQCHFIARPQMSEFMRSAVFSLFMAQMINRFISLQPAIFAMLKSHKKYVNMLMNFSLWLALITVLFSLITKVG